MTEGDQCNESRNQHGFLGKLWIIQKLWWFVIFVRNLNLRRSAKECSTQIVSITRWTNVYTVNAAKGDECGRNKKVHLLVFGKFCAFNSKHALACAFYIAWYVASPKGRSNMFNFNKLDVNLATLQIFFANDFDSVDRTTQSSEKLWMVAKLLRRAALKYKCLLLLTITKGHAQVPRPQK